MKALLTHTWPGNVRELRAVVENAAILTRSGLIGLDHVEAALSARSDADDSWQGPAAAPIADGQEPITKVSPVTPGAEPSRPERSPSLPDLQRDLILRAFEDSQHNLSKAALDLGIPRSTLRARLRRYGVR
jgi:transcriptional regulator of acetoin/glycerol metabolism